MKMVFMPYITNCPNIMNLVNVVPHKFVNYKVRLAAQMVLLRRIQTPIPIHD